MATTGNWTRTVADQDSAVDALHSARFLRLPTDFLTIDTPQLPDRSMKAVPGVWHGRVA